MGRWGNFNEDSGGKCEKVEKFFFLFFFSRPIVVIANATIGLGPMVASGKVLFQFDISLS